MVQIKVFTFSPLQENTYLLFNQLRNTIIIDPGCYTNAERETLKNFIKQNKLNPVQLLNTHCHLDHVFGNKFIHDEYGLEPYLHKEEEKILQIAELAGEKWGLPFKNYTGVLHFLQEGDIVFIDDDVLSIFFTPGHSPGSICFYNSKQNFVIAGDVLFRESIGRTDLPGGDYEILLNSIQKKLFTLPDNTVVYPGHGALTNILYEKNNNPFFK